MSVVYPLWAVYWVGIHVQGGGYLQLLAASLRQRDKIIRDLGLSFVSLAWCCCVGFVCLVLLLFVLQRWGNLIALDFVALDTVSFLTLLLSYGGLRQCRSQVSGKCWLSGAFSSGIYCVTRTVKSQQHQGSVPGPQSHPTLALELLLLTLSVHIKN